MFRWTYILPRLAGGLLVWLALHFGLSPAIRWSLIESGQRSVGGKVDVGRVTTSLWAGQVKVTGLEITNPRSPLKNLAQIDNATLQLNSAALLRRRVVVDHGSLRGLRFDTQRRSSGALPGVSADDDEQAQWDHQQVGDAGLEWLQGVGSRLEEQLEQDLKSVPLSRELAKQWSAEYDALEKRIDAWKARIEQLRQLLDKPDGDVLQQVEFYQGQLTELDKIRRELPELRREIDRLREQVQTDRVAIDDARQHDAQYVRERLYVEQLDSEQLSYYLLGDEMSGRLETLVQWVQRGRALWNIAGEAPEADDARLRGKNLLFGPHRPDFLIRMLDIDGVVETSDGPLEFVGTAAGVTHQPRLHGQPAEFKFRTQGPAPWLVHATLDHRGEKPRERITIECPQWLQPQRSLGAADKLAVVVGPGSSRLLIDLRLEGAGLDGKVHWQQDQLQLDAQLADAYGGRELQAGLQSAVSQVTSLDTTVHLGGSLKRPQWKLQSSLGSQLATGFRQALTAEVARRGEQVRARLDQVVQQQLGEVDKVLLAQQGKALEGLQLGEQQLDQFKQKIASRIRLPGNLLRGAAPLRKLFR